MADVCMRSGRESLYSHMNNIEYNDSLPCVHDDEFNKGPWSTQSGVSCERVHSHIPYAASLTGRRGFSRGSFTPCPHDELYRSEAPPHTVPPPPTNHIHSTAHDSPRTLPHIMIREKILLSRSKPLSEKQLQLVKQEAGIVFSGCKPANGRGAG